MLLTIVSLLWSYYASAVALSLSPIFPLEIFGSPNTNSKALTRQWNQAEPQHDHDRPQFSTPSFPGDDTGDSPFFYCPESDPETDIFDIYKIVLNPNPPRINHVFIFHAHGYFREEIIDYSVEPFRVRCTVRNEDRHGLDFTFERDFCDFVDMMEMDRRSTICPPLRGNGTIHKFEFVDFGISEVRVICY